MDAEGSHDVTLLLEEWCHGDEIAEVLGVSNVTARRRLRLAKAWLYRHLVGKDDDS